MTQESLYSSRRLAEGLPTRSDGFTHLTEAEQQILVEWNARCEPYPRDQCVHHLFEAQAARVPDAVALVFEGEKVTYRELNGRANQLSHHLRGLGIGPEILVGIHLAPSLDLVVALLAVLKAGGAYVPLDPALPRPRLEWMLEDVRPRVVVSRRDLADSLHGSDSQWVCLDRDRASIVRAEAGNPPGGAHARNLAYVIYTSGSTGQPKGVQIEHRSIVNFLTSVRRQPGLTQQDRLLAVTTPSFDIAGLELFLPLTTGAQVWLTSRETARDGRLLCAALAESRATVMQATPATWRLLLQAGWPGSPQLTILCGGEALTEGLARQLLERGKAVWNLYGPTETTIWSTAHHVQSADGPIPIGRPLANTRIYLLDPGGQPVPIGVVGELYIGGDGLARGYLKRPTLTAERFIPDPFTAEPRQRLYRTGDLARFLPDGTIECLGRLDDQVKIRGYRIELGEIESWLDTHAAVGTAVVAARVDGSGEAHLAAYVLPAPGRAPTVAELRDHLRQHLPEYMLPSTYVLLDTLPLTPNGKVDRAALPDVADARPVPARTIVPPRDAVEVRLVEIWEQMLDTRPLGVTDDFFDLGGHSLLAARLVTEVEKAFGKIFPLSILLDCPTAGQLAEVLRQGQEASPRSCLIPLRRGGTRPPLFIIPGTAGEALGFRDLARYLSPAQPVYALQGLVLDGTTELLHSAEDIAARYLQEIQRIQPAGPYFLSGESFGGALAFEMAQQLRARGQRVAIVVLFDTQGPGGRMSIPKLLLDDLWTLLRHLRGGNQSSLLERVKAYRRGFGQVLFKMTSRLRQGEASPGAYRDYLAAMLRAESQYQPRRYPGPVTLFRATGQFHRASQDPLRWGAFVTGEFHVQQVPGDHLTLLKEPHVQNTAECLSAVLRRAQGSH